MRLKIGALITVLALVAVACGDDAAPGVPNPDGDYEGFLSDRFGWAAGTTRVNASLEPPSPEVRKIDLYAVFIGTSSSTDAIRPRVDPSTWLTSAYATSGLAESGADALRAYFKANTSGFLEIGDVRAFEVTATAGTCTGFDLAKEGVAALWARTDVDLSSYDRDGDGTVRSDEVKVMVFNNCSPGGAFQPAAGGNADGVAYDLGVPFMHNATGLATVMHELMHTFSAEDLYQTKSGVTRCYGWCTGITLMGSTNDMPLLLEGAHRFSLGWVVPPVFYMGSSFDYPITDDGGRLRVADGPPARLQPSEDSSYALPGSALVFGDRDDEHFIVEVRIDENTGADYDLRPAAKRKAGIVVWRARTSGAAQRLRNVDNNSPALVKTVEGHAACASGLNDMDGNESNLSSWLPGPDGTLEIPLMWSKSTEGEHEYSGYSLIITDWDDQNYTGQVTVRASQDPTKADCAT